jgi:hypothetical protein
MTATIEIPREHDNPCTAGCTHGEDVSRDGYGRPVIPGVGTCTRVTTVAGSLDSGADALMLWFGTKVVEGVVRDRGLLDLASAALGAGDESGLKHITNRAADVGGRNIAADRGTAMHAQLRSAVMGRGLLFPDDDTAATVAAVTELLAKARLKPVLSEQFVVDAELKVAGTYDLLLQHLDRGTFHVGDFKSSAKLNDKRYPHKVAIQLAEYAGGQRWCPVRGWLRDPPIDQEVGYLLSVPIDAGTAFLDPIDLAAGRAGLRMALAVRDWKKRSPILK